MARAAHKAYKLNVRAGLTKAYAVRQNEYYAQALSQGVLGLGKQVLARYAADALDLAVRETVHDSSRAAANWDLAFSGEGLRDHLAPAEYGTPPIGYRGDGKDGGKNGNVANVLAWKADYYGYQFSQGGSVVAKNGTIGRAIKMCEWGTPPRVQLFNPIFSEEKRNYAKHAFKGYSQIDKLYGKLVGEVASNLSSDFIPKLVDELRISLKTQAQIGKKPNFCK